MQPAIKAINKILLVQIMDSITIYLQTFRYLPHSVMLCSTFYRPSGFYSKLSALQVRHWEEYDGEVFCLTLGSTWHYFCVW